MPKSSDDVIESLLVEKFVLSSNDLDSDQVVKKLSKVIKKLLTDKMLVVSLVGGAASGKSQLANRLVEALEAQGIAADSIGTDDANMGDRAWRREKFEGENPPSPLEKYDFLLLNKIVNKIRNLKKGESVDVPVYDEKTGLAVDGPEWPHEVGNVDVLFVQGDFHPIEDPDIMIYLHMPDEQRLENRKQRDVGLREGSEQAVVDTFNYRQANQHFPYTLTYANDADIIVVADASLVDSWQYSVYEVNQR